MERQEIQDKVKEFIAEIMEIDRDKINTQDNIGQDLGMDDMDEINLVMMIEDHFNIDMDAQEAIPLLTVLNFIDHIEYKVN